MAGIQLGRQRHRAPLPRQRLLRLHVPRRGTPDRSRPGLCGRTVAGGHAAQPRRLRPPGRGQSLSQPQHRREPDALSRNARRRAGRRCRRAAREDRHGQPEHQHAGPGHLPDPPGDAPPHRRQVVHLPDVHLCAPDRGCAGEHHPQPVHAGVRGPAAVLRLAAGPARRRRPDQPAAPAPIRIRAAQPDLCDHQQAQAQAAGGRKARERMGRPAHAHHRRPASARLHARKPAPVRRAHRRHQERQLD